MPFQVTLEGLPKNPEELDNYYKNRGPIPKFSNEFGCIQDVVGYSVNESALGTVRYWCNEHWLQFLKGKSSVCFALHHLEFLVGYMTLVSISGQSGMITGNVSGPCMSGFYYVTALPTTNLYLLIIENYKQYKDSFFYNFNCRIAQRYGIYGLYEMRLFDQHTGDSTETVYVIFRPTHILCPDWAGSSHGFFFSVVNSGAYRIINGTCAHKDTSTSTLAEEGKCPDLRDIRIPCTFNSSPESFVSMLQLFSVLFALLFSWRNVPRCAQYCFSALSQSFWCCQFSWIVIFCQFLQSRAAENERPFGFFTPILAALLWPTRVAFSMRVGK